MSENASGEADSGNGWRILHAFADEGVESEALAPYGRITRVGLDPQETPHTDATIAVDLTQVDLAKLFTHDFDLGLFHPPCYKWTQRDDEDAENLIPLARKIAREYCDEWIIENQPNAPLHNPTILKGEMFGLPVAYERAFETSYPVEQPSFRGSYEYRHRVENTRPKSYWGAVKGYSHDPYNGQVLATNSTPRSYIDWLLQPLLHTDALPDTEQATL
jgi:hypothetical protein